MNGLTMHLLLVIGWVVLTGSASFANITLAVLVSFFGLLLARRVLGCQSYLQRFPLALWFIVRMLVDLVVSSIIVVIDIFTPRNRFRPRILRIPVRGRSDLELTFLANAITLTPGTTTLDVTADRDALIVHAMYAEDAEAIRRQIQEDLEPRLLAVMRESGPDEEVVACS